MEQTTTAAEERARLEAALEAARERERAVTEELLSGIGAAAHEAEQRDLAESSRRHEEWLADGGPEGGKPRPQRATAHGEAVQARAARLPKELSRARLEVKLAEAEIASGERAVMEAEIEEKEALLAEKEEAIKAAQAELRPLSNRVGYLRREAQSLLSAEMEARNRAALLERKIRENKL